MIKILTTVIFCALTVNLLAQTAISPSLVPEAGTFYLMSSGADGAPLPYDPYPGCAVYSLGDDHYAIDDQTVAAAKQALAAMSANDVSIDPSDGGSPDTGTNSYSPDYSFSTNGLWIELTSIKFGFNQRLRTKLCNLTFKAFAIFDNDSTEIVRHPFSNKEIKTTESPTLSASFSWVSLARLRRARILSPKTRRCVGTEATTHRNKIRRLEPFTLV